MVGSNRGLTAFTFSFVPAVSLHAYFRIRPYRPSYAGRRLSAKFRGPLPMTAATLLATLFSREALSFVVTVVVASPSALIPGSSRLGEILDFTALCLATTRHVGVSTAEMGSSED